MPEIPGVEVAHDFVDAGGLRMHVASAGPADAEPLVLLHGWPQHWYAWRRLIGPLSQRYRVIAPDLRGFGWTDAPSGGYEKRELAADVVALLDALGLDRVRLAGHDWGGFVGFLLCLEAPGAGLALRRRRHEPPLGPPRARHRRRRSSRSAASPTWRCSPPRSSAGR